MFFSLQRLAVVQSRKPAEKPAHRQVLRKYLLMVSQSDDSQSLKLFFSRRLESLAAVTAHVNDVISYRAEVGPCRRKELLTLR